MFVTVYRLGELVRISRLAGQVAHLSKNGLLGGGLTVTYLPSDSKLHGRKSFPVARGGSREQLPCGSRDWAAIGRILREASNLDISSQIIAPAPASRGRQLYLDSHRA